MNIILEGPHKGKQVETDARRYVAPIDAPVKPDGLFGLQYAHYSWTPNGYRLEGISRSPTTLHTAR